MLESYSIFYVAFFAKIKSITDRSVPLTNVWFAGGPGSIPFRMYHPHCSHMLIIHLALELTALSALFLGISFSPILGANVPMRAFQSPHTMEFPCVGIHPSMSSM